MVEQTVLSDARSFVRILTMWQGQQIGSPDNTAFFQRFITAEQLTKRTTFFRRAIADQKPLQILEEV